ncbi:hypothetical protein CBR_g17014 [Chara braunii]|uniref:DDE Tnp4 domain-containing protein n=1 Tax=Chara braunii TaxID=69332 RepID=A0A388KUK6_CHABU|nr:hypothetical protein CBR_g17014 [Chara braunii]|eukprot:GBG73672.1 hypothetical protein CBR_g17014 [Chara braunii]
MEGCDGDGRVVLSRTEKTIVARAAGRMKATLSRRRQRLLLQRVLDAPDCITTSEAVVQLCAAIESGVLPRATPRWWMRRRAGGTWEDLRVCDDTTDDYFREKLRMSRSVHGDHRSLCSSFATTGDVLQGATSAGADRRVCAVQVGYRRVIRQQHIILRHGQGFRSSSRARYDKRYVEGVRGQDIVADGGAETRRATSVMVDLDLLVLDVFIGYPGSCHDIRVIQLSSLSRRAEEGMLFRGPPVTLPGGVRTIGYILGDNGYPPSEWVVVPYGGINQHPNEERFDTKQKVARGVVERAFGRLKGMWRLFLRTHKTNLDTLPQQFTDFYILYNILIDAGIEFDENLLWEVDENAVRRRVDLGIHHPPQPVAMLTSTHAAHTLRNALAERMKHM